MGAEKDVPYRELKGFFTAGQPGRGSYRYIAGTAFDNTGGTYHFVIGIPLADMNSTLSRLVLIEILVGLGVLAAVGGAGYWLVRLGLRPLTDIEHTAGAIAAGDLSRRIDDENPKTEVGRLGGALNTMLGTIEAAFAERKESERRLRQFVADASHELQTPLTSVRGYAELFRRGAADRPRTSAPRCGASKPSPSAWACWSTTCCCSPTSIRTGRWGGEGSTCGPSPAIWSATPASSTRGARSRSSRRIRS